MTTAEHAAELRRILADGGLDTVFQPIVDLETMQVRAFEALTRGPAGSSLEMPDALFPAAAETGLTTQLDLACIRASLTAARRHGLTAPFSVFVNVEADTIGRLAAAPPDRPVVIEITERNLLNDPGALIRSARSLHDAGMLIAMDDVGTDPASLALLPLLQPDIIKLDMGLLQKKPGRNAALVMDAISTYTEQIDTIVLAEGVESERDLIKARALGATLAQGWFFGRPDAVPQGEPAALAPSRPPRSPAASTPFDVAAAARDAVPSTKPLLIEASKFLEACALECDETTLVFSTFQDNANFNSRMLARYTALSERASLVAAFVQAGTEQQTGLPSLPNLRVASFDATDRLAAEWSVIVLSSRYCAMLSARETHEQHDDGDRFEYILTHDRRLVTLAAITLANRL
ncbi:sensor domain-containing phosphodiesterase [Subtercola sp. YIM 133946]|uniref:sensor domain-containing phosphodiesterase n=1 Tax=Subtercola sp. YIM 133946 TaxID=3118909 RepID=UPI002F957B2B